ncbi:MAG: hypothetical protein ACXAE3_07675 [Candidatus Kariarchaeaceae archaeon]|jgi:hypothetical protein
MSFAPVTLALTLPKGYAKEYMDREWFNTIYFQKLSMYHEQEGYIPILYNFIIDSFTQSEEPTPEQVLMTFYYPEKRMSNLNGLVIIGGRPDIYTSFQMTKTLTPYLESLTLDEHGIGHLTTISVIDETLRQLATPTSVRPTQEVIERSQGKTGEQLSTFFPVLADEDYKRERLSLPTDFAIDAVFMFQIDDSFFSTTEIGMGINTMRMYAKPGSETEPSLAFPLVFKWQPVYNDILTSLKNAKRMMPSNFDGRLVPSVIIFERHGSDQNTALISAIGTYEDKLYYHVALANSGAANGQPLSLLQSALSREKFGREEWSARLVNPKSVPEDSIRDEPFGEDFIYSQLNLIVPETDLTADGRFDLGKLRAIKGGQNNA